MQWNVSYSAWPVFLKRLSAATYELEKAVSTSDSSQSHLLSLCKEIVHILRLFSVTSRRWEQFLPSLKYQCEQHWLHEWLHYNDMYHEELVGLLEAQKVTVPQLKTLPFSRLEELLASFPSSISHLVPKFREVVYNEKSNAKKGGFAIPFRPITDDVLPWLTLLCYRIQAVFHKLLTRSSSRSNPSAFDWDRWNSVQQWRDHENVTSGTVPVDLQLYKFAICFTLDLLSNLMVVDGDGVLKELLDSRHSNPLSGMKTSLKSSDLASALFEKLETILTDIESVEGTYTVTLASLRLVLETVRSLLRRSTVVDVREPFRLFDQNGDGSISWSEFEEGLKRLGYNLSPGVLKQLQQAIDEDRNDTIEYHEFVAFVQSYVKRAAAEPLDAPADADSASLELVQFVRQLTHRDERRLAAEKNLLSGCVRFAQSVFAGHRRWTYAHKASLWKISFSSLSILHEVLSEDLCADVYEQSQSPNSSSVSSFSKHILGVRDRLLKQMVADPSLSRSLVTSAVYPSILGIGVALEHVALNAGNDKPTVLNEEEESINLLPLPFDLAGGSRLLPPEVLWMEKLSLKALLVLHDVLRSKPVGDDLVPTPSSVHGLAWAANAKAAMLTQRLDLAYLPVFRMETLDPSTPVTLEGLSSLRGFLSLGKVPPSIESRMNTVFALAGMTGYIHQFDSSRARKLKVQSVKVMKLLCYCLASAAQEQDRSVEHVQQITGYLGSDLPQLQALLLTPGSSSEHEIAVFQLTIAAFHSGQTGLLNCLLNCSGEPGSHLNKPKSKSVVSLALKVLKQERAFQDDSERLCSALAVLHTLWILSGTRAFYKGIIDYLRHSSDGFWRSLSKPILSPVKKPLVPRTMEELSSYAVIAEAGKIPRKALLRHSVDEHVESKEGSIDSTGIFLPSRVSDYCYSLLSRAFVFHIFAMELYSTNQRPEGLQEVMKDYWPLNARDYIPEDTSLLSDFPPSETAAIEEPTQRRYLAWTEHVCAVRYPGDVYKTVVQAAWGAGIVVDAYRRPGSLAHGHKGLHLPSLTAQSSSQAHVVVGSDGRVSKFQRDPTSSSLDDSGRFSSTLPGQYGDGSFGLAYAFNVPALVSRTAKHREWRDALSFAYASAQKASIETSDVRPTPAHKEQFDLMRAIWGLTVGSCSSSIFAAQLEQLKAWRAFVEIGCLRTIPRPLSSAPNDDELPQAPPSFKAQLSSGGGVWRPGSRSSLAVIKVRQVFTPDAQQLRLLLHTCWKQYLGKILSQARACTPEGLRAVHQQTRMMVSMLEHQVRPWFVNAAA